MSMEIVILIVIGVLALILYGLYVKVISTRNRALEALSSIDVQLRKRYDLLRRWRESWAASWCRWRPIPT